jgi:hypothetical protein
MTSGFVSPLLTPLPAPPGKVKKRFSHISFNSDNQTAIASQRGAQ